MAAEKSRHRELSHGHKLFLAIGVPLFFFGLLEGAVRLLKLEQLLQSGSEVQLEMPAWMLNDANAVIRQNKVSDQRANIDWFNIFEQGDGFRVRLVPDEETFITNTFSLIKYDRKRKYFVKSNSLGFRGAELSPQKPPGVYRILLFGDSSSFGWGVNFEESFSGRLNALLRDSLGGRAVEIGNFAIPGDSSEYGKLIAEKFIPRFKSDLIIFGFGANDAKKTYVPHKAQVRRFRSSGFLQSLKYWAGHSALFRLLESVIKPNLIDDVKGKDSGESLRKQRAVPQKRYLDNLRDLTELAKKHGAKPFILNLCTPSDYANAARKLAGKRKVPYFNGQTFLVQSLPAIQSGQVHPEIVREMEANYKNDLEQNSLLYITSDGCHPNTLGHAIIAEQLAEQIKPLL